MAIIEETNKQYHDNREYISKSRLSNMSVCPQYFKWCDDNPKETTDDLVCGSAFHKWVLEKDTFDTEFVVCPAFDKRFKSQKEQARELEEMAKEQGKQIISEVQFKTIEAMKKHILANEQIKKLLNGEHEKSFYFIDDLTEEKCKARPDCYRVVKDRVLITDLKTCRSAIREDFMRDVVKYGYDLQAYMYSLAVSKCLNVPIENIDFVFVAIEKTEPYLSYFCCADSTILQRGEAIFRKYIGIYHQCRETGNWYGLNGEYDKLDNLSLPIYLLNNKGE